MATTNLTGFGHVNSEEVAANKTLDVGDSGVLQNVLASCIVTLPTSVAGSAGAEYLIRVGAPGITLEIAPNAADKIMGGGLTAADDKSIFFTDQPAGSYVCIQANAQATTDSAWVITRLKGAITRET